MIIYVLTFHLSHLSIQVSREISLLICVKGFGLPRLESGLLLEEGGGLKVLPMSYTPVSI